MAKLLEDLVPQNDICTCTSVKLGMNLLHFNINTGDFRFIFRVFSYSGPVHSGTDEMQTGTLRAAGSSAAAGSSVKSTITGYLISHESRKI